MPISPAACGDLPQAAGEECDDGNAFDNDLRLTTRAAATDTKKVLRNVMMANR